MGHFEQYKEHRSIRSVFAIILNQMLCKEFYFFLALVTIWFSRAESLVVLVEDLLRSYEEHLLQNV